jgi:hypothetical protein
MCAPAAATHVREKDDVPRFVGSSSSSDLVKLRYIFQTIDFDDTNSGAFAAPHKGPGDTLEASEASDNTHCGDEDLGPDIQVRSWHFVYWRGPHLLTSVEACATNERIIFLSMHAK